VHITGPGDFGILGFWAAHSLGIPLVASWHTNLHEYAGRRLDKLFSRLPTTWRNRIIRMGEDLSLDALMRFYRLPRFALAPNESMIRLLRDRTHRPTYFLPHGVDTGVYSPTRRNRRTNSFCIGYVGRLTPEKSVRVFVDLEQRLLAAGQRDFRLVVIGEGSEKEWLKNNLRYAELPGILRGDALAEAFANMDVFVFPSRTDTFGLTLLEAMASGVPAVVSPEAAIRVEVQDGITGFVAPDIGCFTECVLRLMKSGALRREISCAARRLLALEDEEAANAAPPLSESPTSQAGDLWLPGPHRVLCGHRRVRNDGTELAPAQSGTSTSSAHNRSSLQIDTHLTDSPVGRLSQSRVTRRSCFRGDVIEHPSEVSHTGH
jgi:phosphatidylinositol alpha 1,6-mannosyltransferase